MKVKVNEEKKNMLLYFQDENEAYLIKREFQKKIRNWKFRTKRHGGWKGDVNFLINGYILNIGFWYQLTKVCEKYRLPLEFEGLEEMFYSDISREFVADFMTKISVKTGKEVRPYQIDSVYKMIKYRFARVDLSTAAGKTFVMLMYILIMRYKGKLDQVLIIEPDSDYVIQTYQGFQQIITQMGISMKMVMVTGDNSLKDVSGETIVIGNFQTLQHRKEEFFHEVDHVLVDEGHRCVAKVIKDIIKRCGEKVKARHGLSGSYIEDDTADTFELIAQTGPIVKRVTKKQLMDGGYAPNIKIVVWVLSYLTPKERMDIASLKENNIKREVELYDHEVEIIRNNKLRMAWLSQLINKLDKNSLVFFHDTKGQYGKRLHDKVRGISENRELYYIDGSIPAKTREIFKERMEEGNNKSLFATYNTYSTGKSINNIHHLVGAEPKRSEIIVNQTLGRGMRSMDGKEYFYWHDIVDDFRWSGQLSPEADHIRFTNILYKQHLDRIKYYIKEGFKYEVRKIDLAKLLISPEMF